MKKNWLKSILVSGLAVAMLAGCGPKNTAAGGEVTVNLGSEPPEMLTFLTTDSTSGNVLRHTVEGLVTLDENNKAVPGAASDWKTSEDGKTVTFTMNENSKWDNGDPVTAKDFEFAFDQLFSPTNGAGYASTWSPLIVGADDYLNIAMILQDEFIKAGKAKIVTTTDKDKKEVKTFTLNKDAEKEYNDTLTQRSEAALAKKGWHASEDGKTFTVELTGPYTFFVNLMSFYNFAPLNQKAYEAKGGLDKYANDMESFVGNGPFKFAAWDHEDKIVLVKNENYWNKDAIKLDKITMKMIDNTNTALNEFENGTIDMIGLTGDQALKLGQDGQDVKSFSDGSVWYFEFNHKIPTLANQKIRQALSQAYDVNEYIKVVKKDKSTGANCFTAPSVMNGTFSDSLKDLIKRPTDMKEVQATFEAGLKELGMNKKDFKVSILGDTGDDALKTYEFFQAQWMKNLGLTADQVRIDQVEFKTRIARMQSHDFNIVFAGWSADYDDPMSYLDLFVTGGGNNHGQYSNPEYDALINKALKEADADKRLGYLKQVEEIIAKDFPIGTIYHRQRSYICSDKLTGVVRNAFSDLDLRFAEAK